MVQGTSARLEWAPGQDSSSYAIEVCDLISECEMNLEKRFSTRVWIFIFSAQNYQIAQYIYTS